MEQKIFVLTNKRTYRRAVRVFVRGLDGKITDRLCMFTTEHLVNDQERNTNARTIAAQYSTNNEMLYHALLSDSGYGKDYVLKDDPEGKLKEASMKLTPEDVKRATLASLFAGQGLKFDGNKPTAILELEYATHIQSLTGVKTQISAPAPIPHQIVDVAKEMEEKKIAARKKYEDDYGEPVPLVVYNDLAFLDGMSNPEFDAEKYIQSKLVEPPKTTMETDNVDPLAVKPVVEDIHALYFAKFQKNVPNMKKNDIAWIKAKLNE